MSLLVAGASGVVIGGMAYAGKTLMGIVEKKAKNNSLLRSPLFEKFLIPMILPITMLVLTLLLFIVFCAVYKLITVVAF